MKATMLLKRDHQTISGLFREFEQLDANDTQARKDCFQRIKLELDVHTKIEEELFYPELERFDEAADLVREARTEHQLVKDLCNDLVKLDANDPDFTAKVVVMRENVEHHVEEEEGEMFPLAKKHLSADRLEKLADQLENRKDELVRKEKKVEMA
jgi:hemerythrin superfamily protein